MDRRINIIEIFKKAGISDTSAKSMATRHCNKHSIEIEHGLIQSKELPLIKDIFEKGSSKFKEDVLAVLEEIYDSEIKGEELPEEFWKPSNILIAVDPFEAAFILPELLKYLREESNFEALTYYEGLVFKIKNFISFK
jgi:hypothetical protein